jgi:prolyl-tRNA synthetase
MMRVYTPGIKTVSELCDFLNLPLCKSVKSIVVDGIDGQPVLLLVRGDHNLNTVKAEMLPVVKVPLTFTGDGDIRMAFGAGPGSLGPVGFAGTVIADRTVAKMTDMVVGANSDNWHLTGVNFGRDCQEPQVADIRNVINGDPSPDGLGTLKITRGIEVGHIFQLGQKYSAVMGAVVLGADGRSVTVKMGCYGIGISRLVAATIEQNHDEHGIIWPITMAPFQVALLPVGYGHSSKVKEATDILYQEFLKVGVEVLLDDRDIRTGIMFTEMELIGIPHHVVVSNRSLSSGKVEYRSRKDLESILVPRDIFIDWVLKRLATG